MIIIFHRGPQGQLQVMLVLIQADMRVKNE